jgi:hypothetical protein
MDQEIPISQVQAKIGPIYFPSFPDSALFSIPKERREI